MTCKKHLKEQVIPSAVYYPKPMHSQEAFAGYDYDEQDYPVTGKLCETVLSLPFHPCLQDDEMQMVVNAIKRKLRGENMADYFVHESSYVDDDAEIGEGIKIWHFCHIQQGARIGENCSLGQNVNVSNRVKAGNGVKIQNNVSIYEGVELKDYVFCGPSCVFTIDLTHRARYPKGSVGYKKTLVKEGQA